MDCQHAGNGFVSSTKQERRNDMRRLVEVKEILHQKLQMKKCTSGDVNCCFPETLAGGQVQLQKTQTA